jgi:hypothetical protein
MGEPQAQQGGKQKEFGARAGPAGRFKLTADCCLLSAMEPAEKREMVNGLLDGR